MLVADVHDLAHLRTIGPLSSVELDMSNFMDGFTPMYAVKFGVWALEVNGTLAIKCPGTHLSPNVLPGGYSFNLLCQSILPAVLPYATIEEFDTADRKIVLRRVKARSSNSNWSFGVIFSGEESELPSLLSCIDAIRTQTNFSDGWEIAVCGPASCSSLLPAGLGVKYIPYESELENGRFGISSKKNFLMENLLNDKALICHTRLSLTPDCISNLPTDFEVVTPKVLVQGAKRQLPYLDLGFVKRLIGNLNGSRVLPCFYDRNNWLHYLSSATPYIDGGLFIVNRNFVADSRINSYLAWGESEDVDWSIRLLANHKALELIPSATAISRTSKMTVYNSFGHLYLYRLAWRARDLMSRLFRVDIL